MDRKLSREERVKKEKNKLKRICKCIPAHKLKLLDSVLDNLASLTVDLEDIERTIAADGQKAVTKNGSQEFIKAHPLLRTKGEFMQKHKDMCNMLLSHMPDEVKSKEKSKLEMLMDE